MDAAAVAVEFEFSEIAGANEARIEKIAAELKGFSEFDLPGRLVLADEIAEVGGAGFGGAAILDFHALAVVGHDREDVGAGAGLGIRPHRIDQAGGEGGEADEAQN